jgi:phosphoglycolate phosphatase-like HAD superfamily hydrolase
MLLSIMGYYGVEPAETLFVGDAEVDREAAARAGTSFMWASDLFGEVAKKLGPQHA